MAKQDELATALRDLLREVRKINDVLLPDGFDARAVRNAEIALAAHGVQGTKASSYKLLDHGDVIQCGDEVLADDTVNWLPLVGWEVGMKWGCNFMPMRRPAGVTPTEGGGNG